MLKLKKELRSSKKKMEEKNQVSVEAVKKTVENKAKNAVDDILKSSR